MGVKFDEAGKCLVVAISGEIDDHHAAALREKIDRKYMGSGRRDIVIDFGGVTFMDSSGIGMIIGRYKTVTARGGKLYAAGMSKAVRRIFDVSGLKRIIPCYDKTEDICKGVERNA